MIQFSVREVVEQAIQTEKLGKEVYLKLAEKFGSNGELKKLFELLATHETKHGQTFSDLERGLKDEEPQGWDEVTQYLRAIVDSEFFAGHDKCLSSLENVKTGAEAVDYSLCFERETLLYYLGLREALKEKETVDRIIREEQSHIAWLNNLKKSLM